MRSLTSMPAVLININSYEICLAYCFRTKNKKLNFKVVLVQFGSSWYLWRLKVEISNIIEKIDFGFLKKINNQGQYIYIVHLKNLIQIIVVDNNLSMYVVQK